MPIPVTSGFSLSLLARRFFAFSACAWRFRLTRRMLSSKDRTNDVEVEAYSCVRSRAEPLLHNRGRIALRIFDRVGFLQSVDLSDVKAPPNLQIAGRFVRSANEHILMGFFKCEADRGSWHESLVPTDGSLNVDRPRVNR